MYSIRRSELFPAQNSGSRGLRMAPQIINNLLREASKRVPRRSKMAPKITEVPIMRVIGNIHAGVVNMDTQRNIYTKAAVVRIMRNIHAEAAHMDTARNIYTEMATMAIVGSIHALVANISFFHRAHVCDHCVDTSHCCHGCSLCMCFSLCPRVRSHPKT
jgi:hypothetical protein